MTEELQGDPGPKRASPRAGRAADDGDALGHLDEQLGDDDRAVAEALEAWREGGHVDTELEDRDEIQLVHLPQLEPGPAAKRERQPRRLGNVIVDVSVELGRRNMTVREIANLKEQDVIELNKLAGESFEVRVNGRRFAWGEVVVLTDMMAVRITNMVSPTNPDSTLPPTD